MTMARAGWIRGIATTGLLLAALVPLRPHHAAAATLPDDRGSVAGQRLAEAWCKECHAISGAAAGTANRGPDFVAIANLPSTTELALKVFLRSNHANMPNLILGQTDADEIVQYILSLKR
jgi:cytochrome c